MTKKKKTRSVVATYLIVVLALIVIIYLLPKVNDSMTQTYLAHNGEIQVSEDTTGYIVRDEVVFLAGTSGETTYKVKEGKRVRKTAVVMKVEGGAEEGETAGYADIVKSLGNSAVTTSIYKAGINGVVSYDIDGYEGRFKTDDVKKIKYKDVAGIRSKATSLKRDRVVKGEPVYKVYNNSLWYIVMWTDSSHAKSYKEGNQVYVSFEDADIKAKVYNVKKQGDDLYRVILKCDMYYADLATVRSAEIKVITKKSSGIIVNNESLAEKEGVTGVYVKGTVGDYRFVPVNVLLSNDSQSVVSESYYYDEDGNQVLTLELYDEILRKP